MKIVGLTILERAQHSDRVWVRTELPHPFDDLKEFDGDTLSLSFTVPKGQAGAYVAEHFPGVSVEVIKE